ncbi:MAG: DUF4373 domain-containing protein [Ruminiclostridium sp.]|nr:DUF4373 domain-containing protein [Ruminiclostridium sp.]
MARPIKENLKYFPFDVDFFEDRKIKALKGKYGNTGVMVYIYILCQVYRESYYVEIDEDFILCMSDDLNISEDATRQILKYLFSRSLLCEIKDSTLAKSVTIVTAKSIQRRYQEAKKDLKRDVFVKAEYWILENSETYGFIKVRPSENKSPINSDKSTINSDKSTINSTKESKVKENKGNETKREESKSAAGGLRDSFQQLGYSDDEAREELVETYGEDNVRIYEDRFDKWSSQKKQVNIGKYDAILNWLYKDLG